jgi:hypothetical protein
MKALPSRISMAPKGQVDTQVSHPVHLSGMTFTLTGKLLIHQEPVARSQESEQKMFFFWLLDTGFCLLQL